MHYLLGKFIISKFRPTLMGVQTVNFMNSFLDVQMTRWTHRPVAKPLLVVRAQSYVGLCMFLHSSTVFDIVRVCCCALHGQSYIQPNAGLIATYLLNVNN